MSTALVRKALELVDQEDSGTKKRRRATRRQDERGSKPSNAKNRKEQIVETTEQIVDDNIHKLLVLSKPSTDTDTAHKIVKRAVKGKPLLEKIEIKKEEQKSILFAEEDEANEKLKRKLKRKRH